ncbi:MAG: hypothetical protein M3R27_10730 [Bacteroidota bacterium]|nr:hypothetical protein [Bacteroidota bacterium]
METLKKHILREANLLTSRIRLRSDGIMEIRMKNRDDISINDLIEINEACGRIGEGKAFPNLFYIDHFININAEARAYGASEASNKYTKADAFVLNSEALKLIGNFYIRFNKPIRPTRIFSSDIEAVKWLKSFS